MRTFLLSIVLLTIVLVVGACSSKNEPSARIYPGDGPMIRYSPSEAGGPQSVY